MLFAQIQDWGIVMFYERFIHLCKERGISPSSAAANAGFNKGTVSVWKKKYESGIDVTPDQDVINKICIFFKCSEPWLRGIEQKEKALVNNDEELTEYLEMLRTRPGLKMMFQLAKDASKEDVERAVKVLEAMFGKDEDV